MKELRDIVAEGMHPWMTPGDRPGEWRMPSYPEILEAADRLIAHVQSAGYQFYEYNPRKRTK